MALWKRVLKYGLLGFVAFVAVSAVLSVAWWLVGVAISLIVTVVSLFVVGAVGYALARGALWLYGQTGSSAEDPVDEAEPRSDDPVDRLTQRYVDGEISETELERRLEHELDEGDRDEIDRELELARSK